MAYIVADLPATGSQGTSMEEPCVRQHWGFVIDGELVVETGSERQVVPAGSAFHVPAGGSSHRLLVTGRGRIAGFEPVDPVVDISDRALAAQGFEILGSGGRTMATVTEPSDAAPPRDRQIEAQTWPMSSMVLTRARFGAGSGYTTDWCDAPHWGLVTAGRIAIEWEDDVEILGTGDVFHCPAGPPGHRVEAADPASFVDLTPVDGLRSGRVAPWRRRPSKASVSKTARPIEIAGIG